MKIKNFKKRYEEHFQNFLMIDHVVQVPIVEELGPRLCGLHHT